jgi:hypothetical protein
MAVQMDVSSYLWVPDEPQAGSTILGFSGSLPQDRESPA